MSVTKPDRKMYKFTIDLLLKLGAKFTQDKAVNSLQTLLKENTPHRLNLFVSKVQKENYARTKEFVEFVLTKMCENDQLQDMSFMNGKDFGFLQKKGNLSYVHDDPLTTHMHVHHVDMALNNCAII